MVLNVTLDLSIEYSVMIERDADPDRPNWEYLPMANSDGDLDTDLVKFPDYSVERNERREYESVAVRVKVAASIVNRDLKDYQIVEWDWG